MDTPRCARARRASSASSARCERNAELRLGGPRPERRDRERVGGTRSSSVGEYSSALHAAACVAVEARPWSTASAADSGAQPTASRRAVVELGAAGLASASRNASPSTKSVISASSGRSAVASSKRVVRERALVERRLVGVQARPPRRHPASPRSRADELLVGLREELVELRLVVRAASGPTAASSSLCSARRTTPRAERGLGVPSQLRPSSASSERSSSTSRRRPGSCPACARSCSHWPELEVRVDGGEELRRRGRRRHARPSPGRRSSPPQPAGERERAQGERETGAIVPARVGAVSSTPPWAGAA